MMRVADDGCGFDPTAQSSRKGLGLMSVNERVYMLGGVLDVTRSARRRHPDRGQASHGESDAP
jgi:signal transduction histidine kinase